MKVTNEIGIVHKKDGRWEVNSNIISLPDTEANFLSEFYANIKPLSELSREVRFDDEKENIIKSFPTLASAFGLIATDEAEAEAENTPIELTEEQKRKMTVEAIKKLISFFTEFDFEPNFRFMNTLSKSLNKSDRQGTTYIQNYFELIDSPYKNELIDKMKSIEFKEIMKNISLTAPTKTINNRFKLYYGSQGTGKTTIAMKECDNRVTICNSSMLPSDLMEDFVFVDGKATFKPSALWRCMEEGKKITLDEINLLPFESLRFLQGILDGKSEFEYKGNTVHIKDGFQIIGTMNLTVNGMTYGLPEPLVDRCAEMKKFKLTPEQLFSAIC